jgi:CheY-like chemotaxis protein
MQPVLLVEDDPEDVYIARRAFERGKIPNPLRTVGDGKEALEFLERTGRYADAQDAPRPALILLDLNLPSVDGREVLRRIRSDPLLRLIPVVVVTTSSAESDVRACYEAGANAYITKPTEFDSFLQAIVSVGRYWLKVAELPHEVR